MLRAAPLILVGLASGCVYDMSRPRRDQSTDRALLGDLGLAELITSDGWRTEATKLFDKRASERAADKRAADKSASDGRPSACSSASYAVEIYYDGQKKVAVCEDKWKTPYVQCLAGQRCASGWHLCAASEYRARIGNTLPDPNNMEDAWISGCIRNGGGVTVVTDSLCTCNQSQKTDAGAVAVAWSCVPPFTAVTFSNDLYIGLVSWNTCKQVGIAETDSLDGAWSPAASGGGLIRSFCCQ